jgi:hypothetical protein
MSNEQVAQPTGALSKSDSIKPMPYDDNGALFELDFLSKKTGLSQLAEATADNINKLEIRGNTLLNIARMSNLLLFISLAIMTGVAGFVSYTPLSKWIAIMGVIGIIVLGFTQAFELWSRAHRYIIVAEMAKAERLTFLRELTGEQVLNNDKLKHELVNQYVSRCEMLFMRAEQLTARNQDVNGIGS